MNTEENGQPRVPDWFVSFADMMTLLLTMFVMLLSFSEPKKDDKFNAVVAQLQRQFGKDGSSLGAISGGVIARHSAIAKAATSTRLKRHAAIHGEPVASDQKVVQVATNSSRTPVGNAILFREGATQLNAQAREELRKLAVQIADRPQDIEIRGYLSSERIEAGASYEDRWEQAFLRSRAVMRFLIDEMHLDPRRLRIGVGAYAEQPAQPAAPVAVNASPKVELYLLEEVARQTSARDVP